jgi:hypothetical protein
LLRKIFFSKNFIGAISIALSHGKVQNLIPPLTAPKHNCSSKLGAKTNRDKSLAPVPPTARIENSPLPPSPPEEAAVDKPAI